MGGLFDFSHRHAFFPPSSEQRAFVVDPAHDAVGNDHRQASSMDCRKPRRKYSHTPGGIVEHGIEYVHVQGQKYAGEGAGIPGGAVEQTEIGIEDLATAMMNMMIMMVFSMGRVMNRVCCHLVAPSIMAASY
jgi:hypothetical protein